MMWSSARCQAQGGTPRRNASLAFRLERLQKFRYGVPPFQKVPVGRSGAFRHSLRTGHDSKDRAMQSVARAKTRNMIHRKTVNYTDKISVKLQSINSFKLQLQYYT